MDQWKKCSFIYIPIALIILEINSSFFLPIGLIIVIYIYKKAHYKYILIWLLLTPKNININDMTIDKQDILSIQLAYKLNFLQKDWLPFLEIECLVHDENVFLWKVNFVERKFIGRTEYKN